MMLILANIAGWIVAHWRIVAYITLAGVLFVGVGLIFSRCGKKQPKLDQQAIIKAQEAIAANDHKQMVEILANSDAQEAAIDQNVANSKAETINAAANSRQTWSNANNADLAAELERRSHE